MPETGTVDVPIAPSGVTMPSPRYRAVLGVTTPAGHSYLATWEVRQGLPEVARGKYAFRLPAAADAIWQLAGTRKLVRAKDGALTVGGEEFSALLSGGAPIRLILTARNGQERGRATLDRAAFDAALDLARQADARGLAKAYDYRSCPRGSGA